MKKTILFYFMFLPWLMFGQGKNHNWLVGYDNALNRATLHFDTNLVNVVSQNFKMAFLSTQGNISDENGNLLMVSNGCWIANTTGDTMLNGSGLNPNSFTTQWCANSSGIPWFHGNLILPFPNDTTKYILFHQTGNVYLLGQNPTKLYYTIIDMNLDNGFGGVPVGQKNLNAINDTLIPGIVACKHGNGRDWWIIVFEDSTDNVYKILLTPQGITSITKQSLGVPIHSNIGQAQFSPDGNKFAYHHRDFVNNGPPVTHQIRLFDFDRCSGMFSNPNVISYTDPVSGNGLSFSSNSKYLYFTTFLKVFQLNTDTSNVQASLQVVAVNDTFYSPFYPLLTDFWLMYLAANGKIYICSGNGVVDMHYINYPDSAGLNCDVQQHALHLPCFYARGNVYHPNYYLDRIVGSSCDTLQWAGIEEMQHDFRFSVSPNPSNGYFKIMYLLPQNGKGIFEMFDVQGRKVFSYNLPQWSTLQNFNLNNLSEGVYYCIITSNNYRASKKLVIIKQ